ncbi:MAG: hypothetical protein DRP78_02945, partial [Candidatus Omnitrophota bacterium]
MIIAVFVLMAGLVFLGLGKDVRAACDYCSEPNCEDYLICEDWDVGTPPADPWPVKSGVEWHGWKPAVYGNNQPGDISTSIYHSAPRSLLQYKADGMKSTVDIVHTIPGAPSLVHIRFYMLIPDGELENISTSSCHFLFVASDSSAECSLDFRGSSREYLGYGEGENGSGYEWGGHYMLAPHSYSPEDWVVETEGTPFFFEDHYDEWVCVEWKIDFANDRTSLWMNEILIVDNYYMDWAFDSTSKLTFSGFTLNEPGEIHYYIDDIVVSTNYIGPKDREIFSEDFEDFCLDNYDDHAQFLNSGAEINEENPYTGSFSLKIPVSSNNSVYLRAWPFEPIDSSIWAWMTFYLWAPPEPYTIGSLLHLPSLNFSGQYVQLDFRGEFLRLIVYNDHSIHLDNELPLTYFQGKWSKIQVGVQYSTRSVQVWVDDNKAYDHSDVGDLSTDQKVDGINIR